MFKPNIDNKGRLLRAVLALMLFAGAAFAWFYSVPLALLLGVSGAFVAFEAIRGWCGLRACGIKTKL